MSNLLKALNELGEVKMSSDVIELAGVSDIKKAQTKATNEWETGQKQEAKIAQIATDAINGYKQARISYNEVVKGVATIKAQAKELGLDLPKDVEAMAKRASEYIKEGEAKIKKLQSAR